MNPFSILWFINYQPQLCPTEARTGSEEHPVALSTNECLYSIAVIIIVIFVVVVFIIIKLTHRVALKSDVPFLGWHCRRGFCLPKNEQTTLRYMPSWKCLGLVHTQLVKTWPRLTQNILMKNLKSVKQQQRQQSNSICVLRTQTL